MITLIIITLIIILMIVIFISIGDAKKKKKALFPSQYLSFDKQSFNRAFSFRCEFCGSEVSSKEFQCRNCGGTYDKNKEYRTKFREVNKQYIEFLNRQAEEIKKEEEYIEKTLTALKKNWVMKNQFYNFEIGDKPHYIPRYSFDFACEYCGTKLKGNTREDNVCATCGAEYKDNMELLAAEKEESLEKMHYDEYQKLKTFEWNQNLNNMEKDAFVNQNGIKIALLVVLGIFLVPVVVLIIAKLI